MGCHFLLQSMKVKSEREVTQSCPTLSDLVDCSLPGFSIHRIFQARVLEWGAIAFSVNFPYTCIFLFQIFYPFKLLQNIKQCPLSCTIDPFCFSILNIPECTCQSQTFTMNFLCPWNFPGKSTGVGCHCLLRKNIIYTQLSTKKLTTKFQLNFNYTP